MRPIEKVLARLDHVRRSGDQFTARCPGHAHLQGDRHPSLSITESPIGKVLLLCHKHGCQTEDILNALGLTWKDLFEKVPDENGNQFSSRNPIRKPMHIEKTYDYTDADGRLLFQVVRFDPKDFRQRRPDGEGRWVWNLKGVQLVLYRLPKMLVALREGRTIYIVEGEKDVEALEAMGFAATCNPMGAGNWSDAFSEVFRDADTVILPDNDESGRTHALTVANSLQRIARVIRIVELPDLPRKGDVSDWIDRGGTAERLRLLVEKKAPFEPAPEKKDASSLVQRPIGQLVSEVARTRIAWLWPGRLALGKLTVLDGDPGMGKSTLYCDLAARITTGRPWPDADAPIEGGVVIVTTEDGIGDTIRPRLEEAGADLSCCRVVQLIPEPGGGPDRVPVIPDDLPILEWAVESVDARLMVIDPLVAHLGNHTSSFRDQDIRRALAPLPTFAERLEVAVLVIRHLNKMAGGKAMYRGGGSIGIIGAARIGLMVGCDPEDADQLILASVKNNLAPRPASLAFRLVGSASDQSVAILRWEGTSDLTAEDLVAVIGKQNSRAIDEAERWLLQELSAGPKPSAEMYDRAEAAGIARKTLRRALKKVGQARRIGFGKDGQWMWGLRIESPKKPKVVNQESGPLWASNGTLR